MIKVITVTTDMPATLPLINSLEKFGWDYQVINTTWQGFGTKLISVYNYLKANSDVTDFVFCDAFDVVALGAPQEFMAKLQEVAKTDRVVCSAEKGLWPTNLESNRDNYPGHYHGFNFINSGLYYAPSSMFIELMEANMPYYSTDDQYWMNLCYLKELENEVQISIDTEQKLFNSHSHFRDGEYTFENNRVQINGNEPVFIHGNGRSDLTKVYELLK